MVGMQGDPLVQHLPADAQLWVTALQELQGDRCHMCVLLARGQPRCTAPLVPNIPPFLFGTHIEVPPHLHPCVLPPLHAARESQWSSGSGEQAAVPQSRCGASQGAARGGQPLTEFSRFISTSFWVSKCTLMATVSTQALSVLRGSSRYPLCTCAWGCHVSNPHCLSGPPWGLWAWVGIALQVFCPAGEQSSAPCAAGALGSHCRHRFWCGQPSLGGSGLLPGPQI